MAAAQRNRPASSILRAALPISVVTVGLLLSSCGNTADDVAGVPSAATQASVSVAEPAIPPPPSEALPQEQLLPILGTQKVIDDWITEIIGDETSEPPSGYAGVWLDPAAATVSFAWKGEPQESTRSKLQAPPAGVKVNLATNARYTQTEMKSAARTLASKREDLLQQSGVDISTISVSLVGNGLKVTVGNDDDAPVQQQQLSQVPALVSSLAGVAATVEPGAPAVPDGGSRWAATAPWRSGAALLTPTGGLCSSGFGGFGSGG